MNVPWTEYGWPHGHISGGTSPCSENSGSVIFWPQIPRPQPTLRHRPVGELPPTRRHLDLPPIQIGYRVPLPMDTSPIGNLDAAPLAGAFQEWSQTGQPRRPSHSMDSGWRIAPYNLAHSHSPSTMSYRPGSTPPISSYSNTRCHRNSAPRSGIAAIGGDGLRGVQVRQVSGNAQCSVRRRCRIGVPSDQCVRRSVIGPPTTEPETPPQRS